MASNEATRPPREQFQQQFARLQTLREEAKTLADTLTGYAEQSANNGIEHRYEEHAEFLKARDKSIADLARIDAQIAVFKRLESNVIEQEKDLERFSQTVCTTPVPTNAEVLTLATEQRSLEHQLQHQCLLAQLHIVSLPTAPAVLDAAAPALLNMLKQVGKRA